MSAAVASSAVGGSIVSPGQGSGNTVHAETTTYAPVSSYTTYHVSPASPSSPTEHQAKTNFAQEAMKKSDEFAPEMEQFLSDQGITSLKFFMMGFDAIMSKCQHTIGLQISLQMLKKMYDDEANKKKLMNEFVENFVAYLNAREKNREVEDRLKVMIDTLKFAGNNNAEVQGAEMMKDKRVEVEGNLAAAKKAWQDVRTELLEGQLSQEGDLKKIEDGIQFPPKETKHKIDDVEFSYLNDLNVREETKKLLIEKEVNKTFLIRSFADGFFGSEGGSVSFFTILLGCSTSEYYALCEASERLTISQLQPKLLEGELLERYKNDALGEYKLTADDRLELAKVTKIGNDFLRNCSSITTLDLAPLKNVSSIGKDFLSDCSSITGLDFAPLKNVSSIGNNFLYNCSSITTLDLSPLKTVTSLGTYFLRGCTSVTTLDLAPLKTVTTVGDSFLSACSRIATLDLAPLQNCTSIGNNFLCYCSSITTLDLAPFKNVTKIGSFFLNQCSSISALDLSPLNNVTTVGRDFLSNCSSITTLDLAPLKNVSSFGYSFLDNCSSDVKAQGKEFTKHKRFC